MTTLIDTAHSVLQTLTLNPSSSVVMYVTVAFSLIAGWIGFTKAISAMKFPMNEGLRPVLSLFGFALICLLSAVLTKAYAAPHVSSASLSRFMPLIAATVIFLAAVVPLACFLMKSRYGQTLSAFIVPLIAATIVVFLAKGIAGSVQQGGKGFSKTKDRTEDVNSVLSK